jgi:RNA polymerase sigma-70 factor, ECF subfamily
MARLTSSAAATPRGDTQHPSGATSDGIDLLYERHLDTVFCYVLQTVPDHVEAEDITAETFAAAMGAFSRFRGQCSELTWLLGIARQKIAESTRRRESRQLRELPEAELTEQQRGTLDLLLEADIRQLPEDAALQKEAQRVIRSLLALLPAPQREALLLQFEYDMPVREIARVLGRTEDATASLLQRGRATIFRRGHHYFRD